MTSKPETHIKSRKIVDYNSMLLDVAGLLESTRHASVRATNAIMTATYWEIGRRVVEYEQGGGAMAQYGQELLLRISSDLTARFGKGFSGDNLETMHLFYRPYGSINIKNVSSSMPVKSETLSRIFHANRFRGPVSSPMIAYRDKSHG